MATVPSLTWNSSDMTGVTIPRRPVYVGLAAVTLLGLGLRLWSLGYGLPGVFNMDERPILDRALTFAKGDPNPRNFLYPTLYLYALFAWEGLYFAVGRLLGWFGSVHAFQQAFFVDPSGHVLAGRALTALFGTATVPAVYLFGLRLHGPAVGLGAALFMAVAPLAVRDAHYVKLDVPVTLFAALAHAALALVVADPERAARRSTWLVAGACAGLAISTQYYAGLLAVPFFAAAVAHATRSRRWVAPLALALLGGLATLCGFLAGSPFFFSDLSVLARDFTELRQVDIDRAVGVGLFSSFGPYARILTSGAVGIPVAALAAVGAVMTIARDWRRGLLLVSFPLAFLAFTANTFPASRYLNILVPCVVVAGASGAWELARLARRRVIPAMALVSLLAAVPALAASVEWNRFFAAADTRTQAAAFIEREVPPGSTLLVQPYSAPVRRSRAALLEALRVRLGDESRAPLKYKLELEAGAREPAYRVIYLGEGGKTGVVPGDVDKLYLSPRAFGNAAGLGPLQAAGVRFVVLTKYGPTPTALVPLETELRKRARLLASFSPYRAGIDPPRAPVPPFRHNGNTWIDPSIERPGPVVDIYRID